MRVSVASHFFINIFSTQSYSGSFLSAKILLHGWTNFEMKIGRPK